MTNREPWRVSTKNGLDSVGMSDEIKGIRYYVGYVA